MELNELLATSVKSKASDLHLLPTSPPLMRIDGNLTPVEGTQSLTPEETKRLMYSLLTPEQQTHFEKDLVLEQAVNLEGIGIFRLSAFHQLHGISAVFRLVPARVPTFDELSLPPIFKRLLTLSHGLIIVAGATGAGKSTTLAAMIDYINTYRSTHIITIEDPIEFVHVNKRSVFNQMQVGRDVVDFPSALRAALRQDPNVILLGELRDLETMRLALTAAETGHLVLATLHASTAPTAINRFVDVFPPEEKQRVRVMLAESLQALICQTLVKKTAGGRVAAFEIMLTTPPIRHYILQDMPAHMESAIQTNMDVGMCTLEQYLQELVKKGVISAMVATNVNENQKPFRDIFKMNKNGE